MADNKLTPVTEEHSPEVSNFLASFTQTGSIEKSMRLLDPTGRYDNAPQQLRKMAMAIVKEDESALDSLLEEKGASMGEIVEIVVEGTHATKTVAIGTDSEGNTEYDTQPDWNSREKFIKILLALRRQPGFGKTPVTVIKYQQNNLLNAQQGLRKRLGK